ncbi:MAG: Helix-hairpin-helix domain [Verrucomicrobia bacterium]|nr:Helix-hairpin-helix domain [Verrucomicrobiota bacterium]
MTLLPPASITLTNAELAERLREIARHRARTGASWYRIVAYYKAAQVVEELDECLAEEIRRGGDPARLPWIGRKIAKQLRQTASYREPVQTLLILMPVERIAA